MPGRQDSSSLFVKAPLRLQNFGVVLFCPVAVEKTALAPPQLYLGTEQAGGARLLELLLALLQ